MTTNTEIKYLGQSGTEALIRYIDGFIKDKPDKSDAVALAIELGFIDAVATASDGSIYTDETGNIFTL